MAKQAQVISGARGSVVRSPNDLKPYEQVQQEEAAAIPRARHVPEGAYEFHSKFREHVVQLTTQQDRNDPITGEKIPGQNIALKFHNKVCIFNPRDYQVVDPASGLTDEAKTATLQNRLLDRILQHKNFGMGKDFWDARDMQRVVQDAKVNSVLTQVQSDPAVMSAVRKLISGNTFPMPDPETPKGDGTDKE